MAALRIVIGVFAPCERRVIAFLLPMVPSWCNGCGFSSQFLPFVIVGLVPNWFGDSLMVRSRHEAPR